VPVEAGDVQGGDPSAYERASLIITSNTQFSAWSEIFGDDLAAVAMVDRLVHHTELISLKGDSYRPVDTA
jgi:DNA replication protein DnaC